MGAGAGAQKITTDVTGNDTAGMVAGMVASGVTAKGLNGIEAEANKLAKAPKGIDGVTEGAGNLAEDVGKAGKGLEGAAKGAESAAEDAGKVVETSYGKSREIIQCSDINSKVSIMQINLYNFLENDNKWQTLFSSAIASVKKTKYNEKECYTIKGFLSSTSLTEKNSEVIIEKETGLFLKSNAPEDTVEREYTFNNIEDSIFAEPDISQYKIKEK